MHPILNNLENIIQYALETWEDEAFQKRLQDARERLAVMVRKNPAGSVGIALLAGFIIGIVTKKRSNE